jgi:hypothetical protein
LVGFLATLEMPQIAQKNRSMAGIWAVSFFSVWLILFVSQFVGKTPCWPQPWKSVVSMIYGLTCILPLPVLSLAPYTK